MKVHVSIPYDVNRNLGKVYNEAFRNIHEDDWLVLTDYDVLFLLPDTIKHLHEYARLYPEAACFTCFTNRIHANSTQQLLNGTISGNTDILHHINLALKQEEYLYQATEIKGNISGFLMMVSKKTWNEIKFSEDLKCLGVDSKFSQQLREKGKTILRMDGCYVFHIYRLLQGIRNKEHLV